MACSRCKMFVEENGTGFCRRCQMSAKVVEQNSYEGDLVKTIPLNDGNMVNENEQNIKRKRGRPKNAHKITSTKKVDACDTSGNGGTMGKGNSEG